jgi:hypothetical protein
MSFKLFELDKTLKNFLISILFVLITGMGTGLIFLKYTTKYTPKGAAQRFNGTNIEQELADFDIPENYPKPISEMLITTHNHILGFAFIFFITGLIFQFNSIINGFWNLTILSSVILYLSFFIMAGCSAYELKFKSESISE